MFKSSYILLKKMEETDLDTYIHIIQSYFLSKVSVKDIQSLSGLSAVLFVFECFFFSSLSSISDSHLYCPKRLSFVCCFFYLLNLVRGCQSNCCLVIGNKIMHKMSLVRLTNLTNENICHYYPFKQF